MAKFTSAAFLVSTLAVGLISCQQEPKEVPQAPPPEIPVVQVVQTEVPVFAEFLGQTYGEFDISIRARVEGFLEGIHFEEGSSVRKGQLLYTIDPQPLETKVAEANSKVAEAQTILVKAESDLNRIRPLAEQNAVSKSDLDAAEAQYGAAQASLEAAQASMQLSRIQLSYTEIKAPISGIIGKTEAKVGDFVGREPNPVVLNAISQIDRILVRFSIPEAEYLRIIRQYRARQKEPKQDERVQESITLILADGSTHTEPGKIDFAEREVDPSTGTLLLQASFDNPDRIIRPGQYAKVRVMEDLLTDALVIPRRCLMELQGQFAVFKLGENDTIVRQPVTDLTMIGDRVVVGNGLAPGDRVVIDALQRVSPGLAVKPVEAEFESQTEL